MPRYIDADELQQRMDNPKIEINDGQDLAFWYEDCVTETPTANVAPVVNGKWVGFETESWKSGKPIRKKYYRCCQCRKASVVRSNYCPHCGAKMDLEG